MPELFLHRRKLESVFELLGQSENDITYSIGWALSQSPQFLIALIRNILPQTPVQEPSMLTVYLQKHGKDEGRTDIEILGPDLHIIIEAKRGWNLPTVKQMKQYAIRLKRSGVKICVLATMSECSLPYAKQYLPSDINGFPVQHVNWKDLDQLSLLRNGSHAEKRLMEQLRKYLRRTVNMQNQESNWVYIVSLSYKKWVLGLNFVQVVNERERYFHPYGWGSGWPKNPPNYLGFRYGGKLQSIHHVENSEVISNFHSFFPEAPDEKIRPHILYKLGPAIRSSHEVTTGKIYPSGRVWAMIDLLLSCSTISEARDKSLERIGEKK